MIAQVKLFAPVLFVSVIAVVSALGVEFNSFVVTVLVLLLAASMVVAETERKRQRARRG